MLFLMTFFFQLEYIRVKVFLVGGFIFLLLFVFSKAPRIKVSNTQLWYFIWLFVLIVSSLINGVFIQSVIGNNTYRGQGLLFFFFGGMLLMTKHNIKIGLLKIFWVAVTLATLYSLFMGSREFIWYIGSAPLAGSLIILSALCFSTTYVLFSTIPLLLLSNETSLGIFVFVLLVSALFRLSISPRLKLVLISILFVATIAIGNQHATSGLVSIEDRHSLQDIATEAILKKPLLGYGAESTTRVFENALLYQNIHLEGLVIDRSHNLLLDIALWSGFLGVISFLAFIYFLLKETWEAQLYMQFTMLMSLLLYSFFQPFSALHWVFLLLFSHAHMSNRKLFRPQKNG